MHVIISVGHKYALAVIPTALVHNRETVNAALPGLSMRLNMMAKGRVENFDYPFFGHKIERLPEGAEGAEVVDTILTVIEHAQFLEHQHISFTHTSDLVCYVTSAHAAICSHLERYRQSGIHNGTLVDMSREEERLFTLKENVKMGIDHPVMIW